MWDCTGSWVWGRIHSDHLRGSGPGSGPFAPQPSGSLEPLNGRKRKVEGHGIKLTESEMSAGYMWHDSKFTEIKHVSGFLKNFFFLLPSEQQRSFQCGVPTQLASTVPHFLRIIVGWLKALATRVDPAQLPAVVSYKKLPCKWKDRNPQAMIRWGLITISVEPAEPAAQKTRCSQTFWISLSDVKMQLSPLLYQTLWCAWGHRFQRKKTFHLAVFQTHFQTHGRGHSCSKPPGQIARGTVSNGPGKGNAKKIGQLTKVFVLTASTTQ